MCLSVREDISGTTNHKGDLYLILCMLLMSAARSSSGMLTIGRIAYRREGGDGSAQRGGIVNYDCVVFVVARYISWELLILGHLLGTRTLHP